MSATIRLAAVDDAEAIRDVYAPFCEATPISFELHAPSVEEIRRRIAKTLESLPWLVGEDRGQIVGYAYASPHRERAAYRWAVDVSAYVRAEYQRTGIGRALYTSLFLILRRQGFFTAVAGITLPNPASVGLHESMGFQPVGIYPRIGFKCGAWHDVAWYQLSLRSPEPEPGEPRSLDEIGDWTTPGPMSRQPFPA